jgi:hypothetical protein
LKSAEYKESLHSVSFKRLSQSAWTTHGIDGHGDEYRGCDGRVVLGIFFHSHHDVVVSLHNVVLAATICLLSGVVSYREEASDDGEDNDGEA